MPFPAVRFKQSTTIIDSEIGLTEFVPTKSIHNHCHTSDGCSSQPSFHCASVHPLKKIDALVASLEVNPMHAVVIHVQHLLAARNERSTVDLLCVSHNLAQYMDIQ